MKTLAIIFATSTESTQWQFSRVMALISYDVDLAVVFIDDGGKQLLQNKIWKSLSLYGVSEVFVLNNNGKEAVFEVAEINNDKMQQLILAAEVII
ncbi:MAG: hypothetical protein L3J53_03600 [Proteobacteria bacterium]|nr:hypothetical protein [Pseudomonadota bacterium]